MMGLGRWAPLLLLAARAPLRGVSGEPSSAFRLIVQRSGETGVFSGDFAGQGQPLSASDKQAVASLRQTFAGQIVPVQVLAVNQSAYSPQKLCAYLKELNGDVSSCEPDVQVSISAGSATPNDPMYAQQWNMKSVNAPAVWGAGILGNTVASSATLTAAQQLQQVRVCMVDTGSDTKHPDLKPNLWINPIEAAGPGATPENGYRNGIDDDGNGIVDDIYGAAFVNGAKPVGDVTDGNTHGTFVAGVVGAVGNNALGVTGLNQVASIISCKFMDDEGNGWVSDAIKCFEYCSSKGAHILSNSWGGVDYSASLQKGLDDLSKAGILFVASAGNEGTNTDTVPHYPSSLSPMEDNLVAVAASTKSGALWSRTNYGKTTVQVAAPGENVLSLGSGSTYVTLTGTSMATPHVAGAAALLLNKYIQNGWNISTLAPNKGVGAQLKQILTGSTSPLPASATGATIGNGLLNIQAALALVPVKGATNGAAIGTFSGAGGQGNPFGARNGSIGSIAGASAGPASAGPAAGPAVAAGPSTGIQTTSSFFGGYDDIFAPPGGPQAGPSKAPAAPQPASQGNGVFHSGAQANQGASASGSRAAAGPPPSGVFQPGRHDRRRLRL